MPLRDRRAQRTPDRRPDSGRASGGRPSKAASVEEGLKMFVLRGLAGQTSSAPLPLTLLSTDGRRTLALNLVGDQEFVALDDLAAAFQLAVHEDSLGALTVSYRGKTIVLTPDQAL